jgi:hypothetical protein
MFPSSSQRTPVLARLLSLLLLLLLPLPLVSAVRVIESSALDTCLANSTFSASLFSISFTPDNNSLALNVVGYSSVQGNVSLQVQAAAYGYTFLTESVDPCTQGLDQLCPLQNLQLTFDTVWNNLSSKVVDRIPSIAYGIPDLDLVVTVTMAKTEEPNVTLACVRSQLSNGQTVYQVGVGWATAIVAVIGLVTSALVSGFGHSNAASHVAVYALSLFNYFQAVAIIGLCAVPLPIIVQSWTQDFAWSMGIIRVHFLQRLATWYQTGTGGTPATILETLGTKSVQVLKRSLGRAKSLQGRTDGVASTPSGEYTVKGIQRVAFRAGMEPTNLFLTGIIFFLIFVLFTILVVMLFKLVSKIAFRDRFQTIHDHYRVTLKGVIFRTLLIGYPLLTILCLWEFTQVDSPAEVFLAVVIFFGVSGTLGLAAFHVIQIARRSYKLHKTPAYMLYSNATVLNKWGFLYIQFRASAYMYIVPMLAYILIKAMFVAFGQGSGTAQAVALVIIEAVSLISASVIRPWMDKPTNGINISICVINLLNAILLLIFTGVFNGPGLLVGISGVIFFIMNAAFALVLLFVVLMAAAYSWIQKDPERRYQPAADDRASFIKSQTALTTELDALAHTARGGQTWSGSYGEKPYDDDHDLRSLNVTPTFPHQRRDTLRSSISHGETFHPVDTRFALRGPMGHPSDSTWSLSPESLVAAAQARNGSPSPVFSSRDRLYDERSR